MNTIRFRCFLFAAGFWLGGFAASAIDVYFFDHFEPKWGRDGSLDMSATLLVPLALAAAVPFGIGQLWLARRFQRRLARSCLPLAVFAAAAAFSSFFVVLGYSLEHLVSRESLHLVLLWSYFTLVPLVLGGAICRPPRDSLQNGAPGSQP